MNRKTAILLLSCFWFFQSCIAQKPIQTTYNTDTQEFSKHIKKEELKEKLYYISSDKFEGRETGKSGQKRAAQYLADYYAQLNFSYPENAPNYFQTYPLEIHQPTKISMCINTDTIQFFKEFYCFGDLKDTTYLWTDIIYVGYGIEEAAYSDYKNLDVKGKVVVAREGQPKDAALKNDWENWRNKYQLAKDKNAAALFIIKDNFYDNAAALSSLYTSNRVKLPQNIKKAQTFSIPNVYISNKLSEDIFGKEPLTIGKKAGVKIQLIAATKVDVIDVENVVAIIEGTDLKDEVVVVSSHYDHIGIDDFGNVCNGADDNGTGTVATMQIAKAFKEAENAGIKPKRTIVFMHFSGEEKGLLGSTYYAANPLYPMEKTLANLNIDMIGRSDDAHKGNPDYVYLIGADKISSDLDRICTEVKDLYNFKLELDYTFNNPNDPNRFYYRSDHYNFAKYGVPVVFFFTGVHEDYHKPTDTAEKIDYQKHELITRYVFSIAWKLSYQEGVLRKDNLTN
jgi:hypothetical protein